MPFDRTVQLAGARARQLQAIPRYREVLRLLDEGMSPRKIGEALEPPVTRQRAAALIQPHGTTHMARAAVVRATCRVRAVMGYITVSQSSEITAEWSTIHDR